MVQKTVYQKHEIIIFDDMEYAEQDGVPEENEFYFQVRNLEQADYSPVSINFPRYDLAEAAAKRYIDEQARKMAAETQ